jgi:RNA polymerase sigma-70 factor (ECF subfamily)
MVEGPAVGLAMVDEIKGLGEYHLFHSMRAELLRQMGHYADSAEAYRQALRFVGDNAERAYLLRRLGEISA